MDIMPENANVSHNISPEDLAECAALQKEEFEVLESIYPEYISNKSLEGALKFEIPVELERQASVTVANDALLASQLSDRAVHTETLSVSVLPPILLQVNLPPSYPMHTPPEIITLRATHHWLPPTQAIQKGLLNFWQAGESTLYNWIEYLRTAEFLREMDMISSTDGDNIISLSHPAPQILVPLLLSYDKSSQSNQFAQHSYPCAICLTTLKGSKCLQLACQHIFCRSCLEDFWKMCIEEGDVARVTCPDPECVKKGEEAVEEEVARVVTDVELQRWNWLREKRALEKDPTVVHCPVEVCQAAVSRPKDIDGESDSGWNRLRQCPRCHFSFCAFCRRTWHGPLADCPIAQYEYLALEYLGAAEGSEVRARLERRYGRSNIRRLIATYEEEKANQKWLSSSTMKCPGCQCHIEKTLGCNHMTCWKCLQHFCYRCGQKLNADQPYAHFSNPQLKSCYQKLFDTLDVDEEEWEMDDELPLAL